MKYFLTTPISHSREVSTAECSWPMPSIYVELGSFPLTSRRPFIPSFLPDGIHKIIARASGLPPSCACVRHKGLHTTIGRVRRASGVVTTGTQRKGEKGGTKRENARVAIMPRIVYSCGHLMRSPLIVRI